MKKTFCSIDNLFSANKMYTPIGRGKLIKSKKYNDWIEKNLPILIENLEPVENFPIEIELVVYSGYDWQSKNDIDNCIKPTIDLLVKANIIPDDSTRYIKNVNIRHIWMKNTSKMVIYCHKIED